MQDLNDELIEEKAPQNENGLYADDKIQCVEGFIGKGQLELQI